jgi:F-type H+-transporting ATPase subunit gamma
MPDAERIRERLDNISTVKPVLDALRTISLSSWQAAQRRRETLSTYAQQLQGLLPILLPHLDTSHGILARLFGRRRGDEDVRSIRNLVLLVVGSERGLCGGFNEAVTDRVDHYLTDRVDAGITVELMVLGERVRRYFEREDRPISWSRPMATSSLVPFSLPLGLTRRWLTRYEGGDLDAVEVIYNSYAGLGNYQPAVTRLIPPELPEVTGRPDEVRHTIVETDPYSLYGRILEQWAALSLYALLLESMAAEHSTRYQLLEGASENTKRLIEDLNSALQAIRRQEITREMQDLAAGAGLIGEDLS